jgi:hypothetical protein
MYVSVCDREMEQQGEGDRAGAAHHAGDGHRE